MVLRWCVVLSLIDNLTQEPAMQHNERKKTLPWTWPSFLNNAPVLGVVCNVTLQE